MAVFLPIVPNWQNGIRDTYEFLTEIFTSRNGSEQRRAERMQARRTISVAAILDGDRLRTFADAVNKAKDGKVQIADFSALSAYLSATAADGATALQIEQTPPWLKGDMDCALLTGRKAHKISIDFVEDNVIVLKQPIVGAVGKGAQLMPLIPASLANSNALSVYTTLVSTTALTLSVEPGTVVRVPDPLPDNSEETETSPVFGPAAIFAGRYVLLRKPNYLNQPQTAFNLPYENVDYLRGISRTFVPGTYVSRTLTATYLAISHAEAMALLDVFVRARGRSGEIYVPTWGHDLPEILDVSVDSIKVKGTDFYDTYFEDPSHAAILIRGKDGALRPCEIEHMYVAGDDTWIVCNSQIGLTVPQISHVSWMFVARFAQDALTIEWKTDSTATITLSFVTLANLAVEDAYGSNWILATGYWRDRGVWEDTNVWID